MKRPQWAQEIMAFITDTVVDSNFGWPDDDSADAIADEIEHAVAAILCRHFGHEVVPDQCGIPSHAYCVWCHRGVVNINHANHAAVCDCLDDSAVCCVESCPCVEIRIRDVVGTNSQETESRRQFAMTTRHEGTREVRKSKASLNDEAAFELALQEERLILEATELIESLLADQGINRKQLADRLGKSKAHVTQLLSGERNLTLRTLAEVAYHLGARVHVGGQSRHPQARDGE